MGDEAKKLGQPVPRMGLIGRGARRLGQRLSPFELFSVAVALGLAILASYPLFRVILRLVVSDGDLGLGAFREVLEVEDLVLLIVTTLGIVLASAAVAIVVGSVMAWIAERTDAGLGRFATLMPLVPFLVPPVASAIGWVFLLSDRSGFINVLVRRLAEWVGLGMTRDGPFNIFSWWGLIFVYALYMVPVRVPTCQRRT